MKAFHNDPVIKEKYIKRLKAHRDADEIIQGIYWENGKGCAIGCTLHSNNHLAYEIEMGIPQLLARLEDRIFEGLDFELAKEWPLKFLNSISVGADLEMAWPKFALWLLTDTTYGMIKYNNSSAINDVVALYQLWIDGKKPSLDEWRNASAAAAYDASAAASAYAYAYAYASAAAYDAAASTAAAAAASAATAAAAYAAATAAADASAAAAYDAAAAAAYDASAAAAAYAASAAASAYAYAANFYETIVYKAITYEAITYEAAKKEFWKAASEKIIDILIETK